MLVRESDRPEARTGQLGGGGGAGGHPCRPGPLDNEVHEMVRLWAHAARCDELADYVHRGI